MDRFLSVSMPGNFLKVCPVTSLANLAIRIDIFSAALLDSNYIDDLDHIIRYFDQITKHRFRDAQEPQYIKFGTTHDNDAVHNIRFGQLKLFGWIISVEIFFLSPTNSLFYSSDVQTFFQPSIDCIVNAVMELQKISESRILVCRDQFCVKLDGCLQNHSARCSRWWICGK